MPNTYHPFEQNGSVLAFIMACNVIIIVGAYANTNSKFGNICAQNEKIKGAVRIKIKLSSASTMYFVTLHKKSRNTG
jgi:hypothetical protein